jgi:pilus assembly protein CpaB
MILMVVAIVCGLAASYMTSRVIADRSSDTEVEKVTVLVAKKNISMGTLLKEPEKVFEEKQFTKGEEPKRAIKTYDLIKDRRLNKPLSAEQFVTPDDLNDKSQDGLAGGMAKGMRAVALKVNLDTVVGGFVLPHSRVDIVSVVRRNENDTYSKIILQNVLVLACDSISQRPDDKQSIAATTVTVQVTPAQAETISLATELGTLRLILRPFGDEDKVTTAGVTPKGITTGTDGKSPDDLVASDSDTGGRTPVWGSKVPDVPTTKQADAAPEAPPAPKTHTLTIFNGDSVTKAVFTLGEKEGEADVQIEKSQPDRPAGKAAPRPATTDKPATTEKPATDKPATDK